MSSATVSHRMQALGGKLERLVTAVEANLRQVSEEDSRLPILSGGWSRKQVIGHLIDSASNNHQRFVRASLAGALDFPGYDQDAWVNLQVPQEIPWLTLVATWANYNRFLANVITRLPENKLEAPCRIGLAGAVTLGFLVEDYMRHLVHHLEQIALAS